MKAYVGVGANLGDAVATVRAAFAEIARLPESRLVAVSSLWRSAPIESVGPDFVNAVAEIETTLSPRDLLEGLLAIERRHGRERPFRNAPRTLDLDLLFLGDRIVDEPGLTLPHPRLHERAFVLEPLAELAPGLVHPLLGPLAPWRQRAAGQRLERIG